MSAASETAVVVVGAGVVGLATAASLARRGYEVVVLERHAGIGQEATTRNSEVVHAGLYYPADSLRARSCREGRERLEARCREWRVPHRRVGKLVVATDEAECRTLERLEALGRQNGAPGLRLLDGAEAAELEPQLRARAALWSPGTGIVDAHAYATSFLAEAEQHGASLVLRSELVGVEPAGAGYRLAVRSGDAREEIRAAAVVNAAGLAADRVSELCGLDVDRLGCRVHPCKGHYFALAPGAPLQVEHLVYPVPSGGGLGIHATVDLAGAIRFGPDVAFEAEPDLTVPPERADAFARGVQRYLPALEVGWLRPDFAGVRARITPPGEALRDFVVAERSAEGRPGWVDLAGIESPGLTAAAALAEEAAGLLAGL